jgi:hypothetical protein
MTALLTFEEVEALDLEACKRALKLLEKTYRLDTPFSELSEEERDQCDLVSNTLLYLEDRIRKFADTRFLSIQSPSPPQEPKEKKKTGAQARQFQIGEVIYRDINEAVLKTGIKLGTLRTYVTRYPKQYKYVI